MLRFEVFTANKCANIFSGNRRFNVGLKTTVSETSIIRVDVNTNPEDRD
jgi:hypothetical protein